MDSKTRSTFSGTPAVIELIDWWYPRGAAGEREPLTLCSSMAEAESWGRMYRPALGVVVRRAVKVLVFPG